MGGWSVEKIGNVRVTWHFSAFALPLLQWKVTMRSACVVELPHVTVSDIKIIECLSKMRLWQMYRADDNKTYLGFV